MNLKTKLESKEGKWVRIHFPDSSFLTGLLMHMGSDFLQLECYGRDDNNVIDANIYTQHLIPLHLVKLITIESSSFIEAERRRLEYVSRNSGSYTQEEISSSGSFNRFDLEK